MANISDRTRNEWMLKGPLAHKGYDWWWHSFTARHAVSGEEKAFFIEFFTCNPAKAQDRPVIVWNNPELRQKGVLPSYTMVKVGHWGKTKAQLHRFFAWKDVEITDGSPYEIKAADCICSDTRTEGVVSVSAEEAAAHPEWMSDAGSIRWNLHIDKRIAYNVGYGAGKLFRKLNSFEMFWHAEGMKSLFSGEIYLNGEKYTVTPETCNGYSDKNWGGDFTSPWVWLSSNELKSRISGKKLENSVFDIGGGRPKIYSWALDRKLLGELFYEGKDYEFNFSKFWTLSGTRFHCEETDTEIVWHVDQTTLFSRLVTDIRCRKEEMLLVNYEAPTGLKRHNRLWNGGTGYGTLKLYKRRLFGKDVLIDELETQKVGCEYGEY